MSIGEYVKKGIERKSSLTEVMERRQSDKIQEYENVKLETLIAEEKKKLQDASPTKIDPTQATNFATMLFAGRTPAEIKEIIHSLTQEEIDKFAYMAANMNPNNLSNMRGLLREPNTGTKEIVEAIKIGVDVATKKPTETNAPSTKDLIDAFKAGIEVSKAQQPTNSQNDLQYKMVENTLAELKATREQMAMQERSRTDKEIAELKNRPSALQELSQDSEKYQVYKKMFGGTDSGATNEFTLKKTEMEQTERLETKKLDWEKEKWSKEQESQGKTIEQVGGLIKTVGEGPIGDVIKMLGEKGAERIRGKASPPNSQAQSPQIGQVKCPNCTGTFPANTQLPTIQCPLCGVQLQSGNQPPAAPKETTTPQEQPAPESTQQPPEVEPVAEKPADNQ